jgi:glutamate synthase domain-containing protein 2
MHAFLSRIDRFFPVRYIAWSAAIVLTFWFGFLWTQTGGGAIVALASLLFALLGLRDLLQRQSSVLRNYPLIGHLRFLLELIRPEIRQYFIESDNVETPFSRQQRSLVYQRAKGDPDKRPFGTQVDKRAAGYE